MAYTTQVRVVFALSVKGRLGHVSNLTCLNLNIFFRHNYPTDLLSLHHFRRNMDRYDLVELEKAVVTVFQVRVTIYVT